MTTKSVEDYIDRRLRSGAAPATINRELACLKTALRIGFDHDILHKLIRWKKLPETNVRSGFLDHDDYRKLLCELPHELKLLLVFGYHYGIRRTELLRFRWEYVDWFSRELRIPQPEAKNKEPKIIPFYGDVEPWLLTEKARRDAEYPNSPWVFSRRHKTDAVFRRYRIVARRDLQRQQSGWTDSSKPKRKRSLRWLQEQIQRLYKRRRNRGDKFE